MRAELPQRRTGNAAANARVRADRAALRDDSGLTLVELLVAMVLLAICMSMVSVVLISTMKAQALSEGRSDANRNARAAVRNIDRQVRSGSIFYKDTCDPATDPDCQPGDSLTVYTQSNGDDSCVQWKVLGKVLQTRSWPYAGSCDRAPESASWRTVVTGVVNGDGDPAPFKVACGVGESDAFGNLVVVDLLVDAGHNSKPVEITTSVEGRNTTEFTANSCVPE
jgi:prepilin-type N-terminal cleavage/methylation domain-containing protein